MPSMPLYPNGVDRGSQELQLEGCKDGGLTHDGLCWTSRQFGGVKVCRFRIAMRQHAEKCTSVSSEPHYSHLFLVDKPPLCRQICPTMKLHHAVAWFFVFDLSSSCTQKYI